MTRTDPSPAETDALSALHALMRNDPQALIRLRRDLEILVGRAEYPRLSVQEHDLDEKKAEMEKLSAEYEAFPADRPVAELRELGARIDVLDEILADGPFTMTCPVCEQEVAPDELFSVDSAADRWTAATDYDSEGYPLVHFDYGSDGPDFEGLYYSHGDGNDVHAVRLPEGWHED